MPSLESSYHAFGLDIGDRSIKAVDLQYNRLVFGKPRLELSTWNEVRVPDGVFSPGRVEQAETAAKLLRAVVRTATPKAIKTRSAVVSLPETTTFIKTIEIPKVESERIGDEVIREAAAHIPLAFEEATLDWQLLPPLPGVTAAERQRVIVAVAPRELVENFSTALEAAGFTILAVEIEAIAIVRGLLIEILSQNDEAIAVLDLGASRSNVIIYDQGTIQLTTSLSFSGDVATAQIAEWLKVSLVEAEKAKVSCGLDPARCGNRIRPVVAGILRDLIEDVRAATLAYRRGNPGGHRVRRILLAGGSANTLKIDSYLAQKLLTRVSRGNPLGGLTIPDKFPRERTASFTTALGLARRAARFLPMEASGHMNSV
ncbi:type IV pilus assembly protein PilM [Patescibacteria group bacterium]|nr:MAG: type IV pilus assembly protein PilM [Patescibacteria group bacterium]